MNILNKHNLKIAEIISDNQGTGLLIKKDRTVANDGRRLVEVINSRVLDEKHEDIIINKKTAREVSEMANGEEVTVSQKHIIHQIKSEIAFTVKNSQQTKTMQIENQPGKYPDYEKLYPKGKPVLTIGFSPRYLAEIFTMISELFTDDDYHDLVKLEFYNDKAALKFSCDNRRGQIIQGLLMPKALE